MAKAVLHGPGEKICEQNVAQFRENFWENVARAVLHGPFEKIFGQNVAQAVIHGPCEPVIIRQIVAHEPFL